jgi:predicted RND superfamily exporter protein
MVGEFRDMLRLLQQNVEAREVTPEDVPPELRRKFVSEGGRFLLQIHPRVNVWDRDGATRFVEELRSVDAEVTGAPVVAYESIQGMERAYRQGTVYALALVALISAVMLRRLRETVIALIPLALGTVWAAGLLPLFDFKLNLANVWGAPLIIGASAEYGLNIVTRVMEAREHGGPVLARSTISAVALNGLTTIAGFGSLLVAHHRGIRSLGLLLTVGSLTSLVAALVVLPVLVGLFDRAVGRNRSCGGSCA